MLICLNLLEENENIKIEDLYNKYHMAMYYVAYNVLKNKEDAENAVQESFVSILEYQKKHGNIYNKNIKSFCCVITKNKSLDILRKNNKIQECDYESIELNADLNRNNNVENIISGKEDLKTIGEILDSLGELTKSIFILKYYNGYENWEIAKILNIPKRKVEMTIYRTKIKLKEGMNYD